MCIVNFSNVKINHTLIKATLSLVFVVSMLDSRAKQTIIMERLYTMTKLIMTKINNIKQLTLFCVVMSR